MAGFQDNIGRSESSDALIDRLCAQRLAATLGQGEVPEVLPPGWHWLWFNPFVARADLGADGHPKLGGFLPETGLPRRMWAGGRLRYLAPLPLGVIARKTSEILSIREKSGKSGRLVFVTLRHRLAVGGEVKIEEEQDIVYREPTAAMSEPPKAEGEGHFRKSFDTDPVLLFRYSALTSNGHRIHYDAPYAREVEGYPDLVVHGPLIATFLQAFAQDCAQSALKAFAYRAVSPLFVHQRCDLRAEALGEGGKMRLWAERGGDLLMQAEAEFHG